MPLLLVDLDDTLVSRVEVFAGWVRQFVADRDLPDDALTWLTDHDLGGRRDRQQFFTGAKERYPIGESVEELLEFWRLDFASRYRLSASTRASLLRAREAGWRIGVVTNGREAVQLAKLDACQAWDLLDAVCISEEIGAAKPSVRIFAAAAVRAGTPLRGGWMIGDNAAADIAGGQDAGLRTAWLRLGRRWEGPCRAPTVQVDTVAEAVQAVLALAPAR